MDFVLSVLMPVLSSFIGLFSFAPDLLVAAADQSNNFVFGIDMSIEGLRSYKFSVAIFIFLVLSLIVFGIIIYLYWPKNEAKIRTGEKIMLGSIIFGMFLAVVIGWIQLIEGYLI